MRKWRMLFLKLSLIFQSPMIWYCKPKVIWKRLWKKGKGIQRQLIETATAKLKVGNERKQKFEEDLCKLERKKNKLMSSKKWKSDLWDCILVMLCYLESYCLSWQPPFKNSLTGKKFWSTRLGLFIVRTYLKLPVIKIFILWLINELLKISFEGKNVDFFLAKSGHTG